MTGHHHQSGLSLLYSVISTGVPLLLSSLAPPCMLNSWIWTNEQSSYPIYSAWGQAYHWLDCICYFWKLHFIPACPTLVSPSTISEIRDPRIKATNCLKHRHWCRAYPYAQACFLYHFGRWLISCRHLCCSLWLEIIFLHSFTDFFIDVTFAYFFRCEVTPYLNELIFLRLRKFSSIFFALYFLRLNYFLAI